MSARFIIVWLLLGGAVVRAQQPVSPATPLGVRQHSVEQMMADVERKLITLKLALQATEPERAERLQQALNRAKELLLQKRMAEMAALLDQSQLDSALAGQRAILTDLKQLVAVLLDERDLRARAQDEFERLGQWKTQIEKFLRAEEGLRAAADSSAESAAELAEKQAALAAQTAELGEQMEQSRTDATNPQPERGAQGVQAAARSMQQAASGFRRQQSAAARQQQDQAIGQLQQALQETTDRLGQSQADAQAGDLTALMEHLREMLAIQQDLTRQTLSLDSQRQSSGGELSRAGRNAVRAIGERERRLEARATDSGGSEQGLAGMAQAVLQAIKSGGEELAQLATAAGSLPGELTAVGGMLADDLQTNEQVVSRQQQIERTIESLLSAAQQARDERRTGPQNEIPGQGEQGQSEASLTSQSRQAGQGGQTGGASQGTDQPAAQRRQFAGPASPWSKLRERERDPVLSAIQQRFPARYQQLLEQYYKSFEEPKGDAR